MTERNQTQEPSGHQLLEAVVNLTGLPTNQVQTELDRIMSIKGIIPAKITLEQFREVMAIYLDSVLLPQ